MKDYLNELIYQTQQVQVYKNYISTLKKTYNLPENLPPLGNFPTKLEALECLNKQYPNNVLILNNLIDELKNK